MSKTVNQTAQEQSRAIDPNAVQRKASEPKDSVWVNASAGSGKTKVLTDRVLRLLLPREDGQDGTAPHKILCLTFTKAGAGEMALRLNKILGDWAVMDEDELQTVLKRLLGRQPKSIDIKAARQLFASITDLPGGLKIMTIHSFCQSVLSRFPLEAGLPPSFQLIEESQAREVFKNSFRNVIDEIRIQSDTPLSRALENVATKVNESQLMALLHNIITERGQFFKLIEKVLSIEGLYLELCKILNVEIGKSAQEYMQEALLDKRFEIKKLRAIIPDIQAKGTSKDIKSCEILERVYRREENERHELFEDYKSVFLTQEGSVKKTIISKNPGEYVRDIMNAEGERLAQIILNMKAAQAASLTRDLFYVGEAVLNEYTNIKAQKAVLDFEDLIFKTEQLLKNESDAAWVMYKLDEGLDHILIDEAQDTNPEQWRIIEALCNDFFSGKSRSEEKRTVFTVGDEKQSIYSFQRASPEDFQSMQARLQKKVRQAGQTWEPVYLNMSFRSSPAILKAVDSVFEPEEMRQGVAQKAVGHYSYHYKRAGRVEIWPLFENKEESEQSLWDLPTEVVENQTPSMALAQHIAKTIYTWLQSGEILPSQARPIQAGDIMILMRTRTNFVNQLMLELKKRNIPVSGADRMVLKDHIAVQDILCAIKFVLLPDDDFNLACLLKSPFIGWTDEQLFTVAYKRKSTLWDEINDKDVRSYLSSLIERGQALRPYDFIVNLLTMGCIHDVQSGLRAIKSRLGEDADDPIEELLKLALKSDREEGGTLHSFVHEIEAGDIEIKRQNLDHSNQVKVMTIHGAKGLEAPIIIMPDTIQTSRFSSNKPEQRILWPNKTQIKIPLWVAVKSDEVPIYTRYKNIMYEKQVEEAKRLLYVAMTRAQDRLYVAGYSRTRKPDPESWYFKIKQGLERLQDTEVQADGSLRYETPQLEEIKKPEKIENITQNLDIPGWIYQKIPEKTQKVSLISPSKQKKDHKKEEYTENSVFWGVKQQEINRFGRGNLIHRLLELLPALPQGRQEKAAHKFVETYGQEFSDQEKSEIVRESLNVLRDPDLAFIFEEASMAEVSIAGMIKNEGEKKSLIQGKIDRLIINKDTLWIIDFKTQREIPEMAPEMYRTQLSLYAQTLAPLYPAHNINCALLWTSGPLLMPVDISLTLKA